MENALNGTEGLLVQVLLFSKQYNFRWNSKYKGF